MKRFVPVVAAVLILTFVVAAVSQAQLPWVTRVFKIRHANLNDVAKVVAMFGGKMTVSEGLRIITWTGPPDLLPGIEQALSQVDVPPEPVPDVELTFYLLTASKSSGLRDGVPVDLQPVTRQLKQVFGFGSYALLETAFLRGSGPLKITGSFAMPSSSEVCSYTIHVRNLRVKSEDRNILIGMSLDFIGEVPYTTPAGLNHGAVEIETNMEFLQGQKAVVGKATIDGSDNTFFLVVTGLVVPGTMAH